MIQQSIEHAASDSVAGSAIQRALSSGAIVNWKIAATLFMIFFVVGVLILYISEWNSIRKAGGFKKWVDTLPLVQYRSVRMGYLSEVAVIIFVLAMLAHAVWPQVVGELQVEAMYAVFAFLGLNTGLNVTAFIGKRATQDAAIQATNAAINDPNVLPLVRTNKRTGETVVEHVPVAQQANGPPITVTAERTAVTVEPGGNATVVTESPPVVVPPPPKVHGKRDD